MNEESKFYLWMRTFNFVFCAASTDFLFHECQEQEREIWSNLYGCEHIGYFYHIADSVVHEFSLMEANFLLDVEYIYDLRLLHWWIFRLWSSKLWWCYLKSGKVSKIFSASIFSVVVGLAHSFSAGSKMFFSESLHSFTGLHDVTIQTTIIINDYLWKSGTYVNQHIVWRNLLLAFLQLERALLSWK